ncbi:MAG: sensor histidine kinase, partial [bacterium]
LGISLPACNGVYQLLYHKGFYQKYQLPVQIIIDFAFITLFLHFTGGITNPVFILYLPHVIISAILFSPIGAYLAASGSIILLGGLGLLEYGGILHHYDFYLASNQFLSLHQELDYVGSVIIVFGGVALASVYFTTLVVESIRKYRKQLISEKKLTENLVRKLLSTRDKERRRIARELHDQIGQTLSALRLKLNNLDSNGQGLPEDASRELKDSVENAIEEVRDLSNEMRPPSLSNCGLPCAVKDYVRDLQDQTGIQMNYEWVGLKHDQNFSKELDTAVYRIVQEAVLNAVEHANPDHISIILQYSVGILQVLVEDDGRGFNPEQLKKETPRDALGIQGMKERVNLLDGKFVLESSPGEGTRIRAEIPIEESMETEEGE